MKIVAGLGNPGEKYAQTPHNVGFVVLERLAERHGCAWRQQARFQALSADMRLGSEKVLLVKPQTFMNRSGDAVGAVLRYYGVTADALTVVLDDVDLPAGRLRVRPGGSAGGHRGLQSVVDVCGTTDFARLRVGVGRGAEPRGLVEHVLGRLDPESESRVALATDMAVEAVLSLMSRGVVETMNRFNGWEATDAEQSTKENGV